MSVQHLRGESICKNLLCYSWRCCTILHMNALVRADSHSWNNLPTLSLYAISVSVHYICLTISSSLIELFFCFPFQGLASSLQPCLKDGKKLEKEKRPMLWRTVLAMFENMKSKSYEGTQRAEVAENESPFLEDPFLLC